MSYTLKRIVLVMLVQSFLILTGCESEQIERHYVVGLATNNPNGLKNIQGFKERMSRLGYQEGKEITYQFSGGFSKGETLNKQLEAMVSKPVDLIFTAGTGTGKAAHKIAQEKNVPVVFGVIADPIKAGVLHDLTRPGGHITGVMISPNQSRRFQYLLDIVPNVSKVLIIYNPTNSASTSALEQLDTIIKETGVTLVTQKVEDSEAVKNAIASISNDVDAIFMLPDSTVNAHQQSLINRAIEKKIPVSGPSIIQVEKGALMAYGIVHKEAGAQAATIADQVLKGTAPGEQPVQVADFYLGVNLKTAEKIGVQINDSILQQSHTIVR